MLDGISFEEGPVLSKGRSPVVREKVRLGWVTTWNTKCGIASYSSYLLHYLPSAYTTRILASHKDYLLDEDGPEVIRCWEHNRTSLDDLEKAIFEESLEVVVFQFQFSFFHLHSLGKLLQKLHARGTKTVIFFHATKDVDLPDRKAFLSQIKCPLTLADQLLVHTEADLHRLQSLGLTHNSALFPQGVHEMASHDVDGLRSRLGIRGQPVLGTYGFLLPHKGILELIEAFPLMQAEHPRATLLLVNALHPYAPVRSLRHQCLGRIQSLGMQERILLINNYLDDDESLCLLGSTDLLVYPYQETSESSSAAVRFGLASHRPVAITPIDIFEDVKDLCHVLPGTSPADIGSGVNHLLKNPQVLDSRKEIRQHWIKAHSWRTQSERLDAMIQALMRNKSGRASAG
jgi:glycosyltransferase involved in cell wall biosynthesis